MGVIRVCDSSIPKMSSVSTMNAPEELVLALPDLTLGGLRWGGGNQTKVLAVHGWLDNAATFSQLAPLLAERDCEVVAIDLPGHGNSQHRPRGCSYHLMDYLREVHQVLDYLGWKEPVLLGHSLGGIIGMMLCVAAPARVAKLILLESLGPITAEPEAMPDNLRKALARALREPSVKRTYKTITDAARDRMNGFGKISEEAAQRLVTRNLQATDQGYQWKSDPRLLWPSFIRLTETQVNTCLQALSLPVHLVAASKGYVPVAADKNPRLTYLRTAQVDEVAGGHHFHLDGDVDKTAQCIAQFLC